MAIGDDTIYSIQSPKRLNHLNVLSWHSMAKGYDSITNSIASPKRLNHLNVLFHRHSQIVP